MNLVVNNPNQNVYFTAVENLAANKKYKFYLIYCLVTSLYL